MTTISGISSLYSTSASTSATASATASDTIGKEEFLKLLVTQLQKQDPLNPEDPTEFTSQLTQFSSLEQLIGINQNLEGLASQQSLGSTLTAAGLIGKTVRISGNTLNVTSGAASSAQYELSFDSAKTSVNVYNQAGVLIDVVDMGSQKAGAHDFEWDAVPSSGTKAIDGSYYFEVVAQNSAGQSFPAQTSFTGQVTGVRFDQGQAELEIGGAAYSLSDVIAIGETA
jgi:flagellar basal-body rod modification protein FlgD